MGNRTKLIELVKRAAISSVANEIEKSVLDLAVHFKSLPLTENEIVTAFLVLIREVAKAPKTNLENLLQTARETSTSVQSKVTQNIFAKPKKGEIRTIDGIKKRYVAASTKSNGTKVKGYWTTVR